MTATQAKTKNPLTVDNYATTVLRFRDRQAGVSLVYDQDRSRFYYNSYCIEVKLLKELYACEFEYLDEALEHINSEFGSWDVEELEEKGCGSCAAK